MLSFHGTFFVLAREGGAQVLDHPVCINYMFLDSKLPKKLGGNWPRSRNTGASNRIGNNISTVFGWFYCDSVPVHTFDEVKSDFFLLVS